MHLVLFHQLLQLLIIASPIVFANKLVPNEATNVSKSPYFSSFHSFSIFSFFFETPLFNKPDSSRYLTITVVSSISWFDIINAILPDPYIFFSIAAAVVGAAAVNPRKMVGKY